jgi:hypothetical protein
MFVFMIISLITMVIFTIALNDLFSFSNELFGFLGFAQFDLDFILSQFVESSIEEASIALSILLFGLFQVYGIPLIVFLVSLNGLASKK